MLFGSLAIVAAALLFLFWVNRLRIERINYVSGTASWSVDPLIEDPQSPTGYADQQRRHIVPGHHNPSYRWIIQTQQLVNGGTWRNHRVDSDNFPVGRESHDALPYRWWLAFTAYVDHTLSQRSLSLAVEHSVLYADPLLHVLLITSVGIFVGVHFGGVSAAAAVLALVTLFPLAGGFQPGAPDHHALAWFCALWSVLPLLAGFLRGKSRLWFAIAGVAGGIGIWTDYPTLEPIIAGVALGALVAVLLARRAVKSGEQPTPLPWRSWSVAGSVTCLIGCLLEYFPSPPDWSVSSINPLHGIAWLGLGELLHHLTLWAIAGNKFWNRRNILLVSLAVLAVGALPVTRSLSENGHFLANDPFARELVNLTNGTKATHFWSWLSQEGITLTLGAVCTPLLLTGMALWFLLSGKTQPPQRSTLILVMGPTLMSLGLSFFQLRSSNTFDATSVVLLIALASITDDPAFPTRRWIFRTVCLVVALPGIFLLPPRKGSRGSDPLGEVELQSVVERDLAYWIARQHGANSPVVFTTPGLTETLNYHGSIKGIASYDPENRAGFSAAVRIASASTWPEAFALLDGRQVTHVILPSWDLTLERFAQLGRQLPADAGLPRNTLVAHLKNWELPPWLRLMTYHGPPDTGSDQLSATVFALQGEQDEILTVCRLADYFIEMGMLDAARATREKLALYPRSLPALASLAQIDLTLGDTAGHAKAMESLLPSLSRRAARALPVDRRISLAALLVQTKQREAARTQMEQCNSDLNADRLRELTTGEIVRLLAMNDLLGLTMPDPQLRPLALSLLPPSLRSRLAKPADLKR
jgi:hypothetical protein